MSSITAGHIGAAAPAGAAASGGPQTIEGYVNAALDDAKISPLHKRVVALIAAGYFCDVIDFSIFGAMVPFIIKSGIGGAADVALIGSATIFGIALGTAGQGELSDRFGRRFIYQFNLLLFGIFTILGALAPTVTLLVPVILLLVVSVAVSVCEPAVTRVTALVKVWTPLSFPVPVVNV